MNMENKQIDKLTRELMKDAVEQPSSLLMAKIMTQIQQVKEEEKRVARQRSSMGSLFSFKNIYGILLFYLLLVVCTVAFLTNGLESFFSSFPMLKELFPVVFTGLAVIAFLFLFSQLDNWLWQKEEHKD